MKRAVAFAAALLLVLAAPVNARQGASITAPDDVNFAETFLPVSFAPPSQAYHGNLWVKVECDAVAGSLGGDGSQAIGVLYVDFINVDGTSPQNGPFQAGPTPSWSGGPATCTMTLVSYGGLSKPHIYATDAFAVAP